jgi:DNA-binding transcriptional LysR family regulator
MPLDLFCDLGHVLFWSARVGRSRRVVMTVSSFCGVSAVAKSDLIALKPTLFAAALAEKLGLGLYRPPMPVDPTPIMLIWHRKSNTSPAHRWIHDLVSTILAPLDEAGRCTSAAGGPS